MYANVPSGSWILQSQSFGRVRLFGRTSFQITNRPANIAITILPIPRLEITVHREFTSTAEPPPIMGKFGGSGVNIQLENDEPFSTGGMMGSQFEPPANSSSDTTSGTIDAMPRRAVGRDQRLGRLCKFHHKRWRRSGWQSARDLIEQFQCAYRSCASQISGRSLAGLQIHPPMKTGVAGLPGRRRF